MKPKEIYETIQAEEVPGVIEFLDGPCDPSIRVEPEAVPRVLAFLKDHPRCLMDQLSLVSGVEYEDRFECVYHLLSIVLKHDVVLKTHLDKEDPHVPTASGVHPTANWHERETFDLVGIRFDGHPDPRRIYLPQDWEGHPLRRDYVFPEAYKDIPFTDPLEEEKKAAEKTGEGAGKDEGGAE